MFPRCRRRTHFGGVIQITYTWFATEINHLSPGMTQDITYNCCKPVLTKIYLLIMTSEADKERQMSAKCSRIHLHTFQIPIQCVVACNICKLFQSQRMIEIVHLPERIKNEILFFLCWCARFIIIVKRKHFSKSLSPQSGSKCDSLTRRSTQL